MTGFRLERHARMSAIVELDPLDVTKRRVVSVYRAGQEKNVISILMSVQLLQTHVLLITKFAKTPLGLINAFAKRDS